MLTNYLASFQAEHGPEAAGRTRRDYLAPFETWLAGRPISPAILMDWRTSIAAGRKPSSRNRMLGAVKSLLSYMRKRGELALSSEQISEALSPYKLPRNEPRVLSVEQIRKLLMASCKVRTLRRRPVGAFLVLALTLGARPGELAAIRAQDVSLERNEVLVTATKTNRQRRVPFHDSQQAGKLLAALADGNDGPLIGKVSNRRWRVLVEAAGIAPCPPKILRATAIAYAASSGKVSEYLLSARFGHSQTVSVEYYRAPINHITGDTFEDWFSSQIEFTAATTHALKLLGARRKVRV